MKHKKHRWLNFLLCGVMLMSGMPFAATAETTSKQAEDTFRLTMNNLGADTGVPLGGIGTGCFDFAPDGRIKNIKINNTENNYFPGNKNGFLLAMWDSKSGSARRLQRDDEPSTLFGMEGYASSRYTGLWHTAELELYNAASQEPVTAAISAFSPVTAQDVKNSSLPVAFFEVTLTNTTDEAVDASVAFSFEDVLGRGIKEPDSLSNVTNNIVTDNGPSWGLLETPETTAQTITLDGYEGVHHSSGILEHKKDTFQNYNTDLLLLADTNTYNTDGETTGKADVSTLLSYLPSDGTNTWSRFVSNGTIADNKDNATLSQKDGEGAASVVSTSVSLPAGGSTKVRFMVSWYAEETEKKSNVNRQSYGTADFNKYYHNYFSDIQTLTSYCIQQRDFFRSAITEWQNPILESTMDNWLKFKQINSGYVLYTNSILNKGGCFTSMEGGMMGLTGTADQRLSSHPFYQKMFPELDESENRLFAITTGSNGQIMHFTGCYYVGLPNVASESEDPMSGNGWMIDNSMSWVIQLAKDYLHTGDFSIIKDNRESVKTIINWLSTNQIKAVNGVTLQLPQGPTTYDDKEHPEVMSYSGSTYLATLQAAQVFADALGDEAFYQKCERLMQAGQESMNSEYLWNGKFYAYGYGSSGEHQGRVDYIFTGMLAGQFFSRLTGWNDILPFENIVSSVKSQISTSVLDAPGYYAPKVYDPVNKVDKDNPGSRTWPFYLDSYTGMLAIQSGYVEDGLTILKSTQKIYLDQGYTWSMSLWNPNNQCTYMTAPVTWFINDVLTGMSADLPNNTLTFGPADLGDGDMSIPVYYSRFWGRMDYSKEKGTAAFTVTKRFDDEPITIDTIVIQPGGTSSDEKVTFSIDDFTMEEGGTYTFTDEMVEVMNRAVSHETILPAVADDYVMEEPVAPGTGDGLSATYYLKDDNYYEPENMAVDCTDGEGWGFPEQMLGDLTGAIWQGEIQIYYGGLSQYDFMVRTDGACKLWVDGTLVLDATAGGQVQNLSTTTGLVLTPGEKYSIRLEYQSAGDQPTCQLYWQLNPHNLDVVPLNQLYAPSPSNPGRPIFTDEEESPTNVGDVTCDGDVNASDALLVLQHSVELFKLTGNRLIAADVNENGTQDASDALKILQYSVGLVSSF